MNIKFPAQKNTALAELAVGESLLFPCNSRTVQSVQSSIQSLYPKKNKVYKQFTQRKALLILDGGYKPEPQKIPSPRRLNLAIPDSTPWQATPSSRKGI